MDLLSGLNEPQKQAVMHINGPLLVLAGAGSGKTRVITRRVAHLVSQGVAPWNILALTFTNKAAEEMSQRIVAMNVPRGAMICTFHSLCARLLREYAIDAGLSGDYTIYDRDDQIKITKQAIEQLDLPTTSLSPAAVHGTISNAKNELKTPETFAAEAADFYSRTVAKIFRKYEDLLAANNALDFDDLLLRMAFLMRERPDIRTSLGERFRYVLIDEYQDTNRAQYIVAHGIGMDHQNICATGDPDQSIYAWRGADIRNIMEFEEDYPDAKVIRLEENYRSTQPILSAASQLISHNSMRKEKNLWTSREGGENVLVILTDSEHTEAKLIARRIARWRDNGGNYSDVGVFYRVNSLSRVLEESLLTGSIPYRIARGVEFYNRKEIKDVLAYLKLLVNPADDLSCLRIINTPTRGIGGTTIGRLRDFATARGVSLFDACRQVNAEALGNGPAKKVAAFAELILAMAKNSDGQVRDFVEHIFKTSGLEESLSCGDEDSKEAIANVEELISTAAEFDERSEGGSLAEYLHQISLVSDLDHMDHANAGAVTLMTLHAAKGLEFPAVFIAGCENGLLPFVKMEQSGFGAGSVRDLEEERRLAFVGMTRAKDELTLTAARYRMIRGKTTPQSPSQFISEIDCDSVTQEDETTAVTRAFGNYKPRARGGFYEDVEQRAIIEAMEDDAPFPPEYEHLRQGSKVHHAIFGYGTITKIGSQRWPETRVDVQFEDCGSKRLVLSQTSLELL